MSSAKPASIDATLELLKGGNYIADRSLATVLFLALKLGRPLFCEGEAGVGKTEIAKVVAETLGRPLICLQCYEGLDASSAVYEWDYARQMIEIRLAEAQGVHDAADRLGYLQRALPDPPAAARGPVAASRRRTGPADRRTRSHRRAVRGLSARNPFGFSGDYSGTRYVKADEPPIVIITSNRTREIHDALKRRCFYHWVDYPDLKRELEILAVKAPRREAEPVAPSRGFRAGIAQARLFKAPGVAETIDWASAWSELDMLDLDPKTINDTLGVLLKYQDDIARLQGSEAAEILRKVKSDIAAQPLG